MKPMPEDWTSAVAVVAHPDDLEYGAASAVARWTRRPSWPDTAAQWPRSA
jgi:LmbE family N-acetylglucosaminyl deacetylase